MAMHRQALAGAARGKGGGLIAEVNLRYLAEGRYPDSLVLAGGVARLGETSYALAMALFQRDRCISLCETRVVFVEDGRARALPETYRSGFSRLMLNTPEGATGRPPDPPDEIA